MTELPSLSPAESARSEEEFLAIKAEIAKLGSLSQDPVDWGSVVENATTFLDEKSKDLLVASYLCVAQIHEDGTTGLAKGLTTLRDLIKDSWLQIYPPPAATRDRRNALIWLAKKSVAAVKNASGPHPSASRGAELIDEIHAVLEEHTDLGPMFLDLKDSLTALAGPHAGPPTDKAPPAPAPAPAMVQTPPTPSLGNAEDAETALRKIRETVFSAAALIRDTRLDDAAGYQVPRAIAWSMVKGVPPNDNGKSNIPAPPADLRNRLDGLLSAKDFAELVRTSEGQFSRAMLWLDLQRYTTKGLEGLGHKHAAQAVIGETSIFTGRLLGLEKLKFADGSPVASGATLTWLRGLQMSGSDGTASAPAPTSGASEGVPTGTQLLGLPEGFEQARAQAWMLVENGNPTEAIEKLAPGIYKSGLLRDQAHWRLEMARILMQSDNKSAAFSQLQILDHQLGASTYDDWDPGLASEVIQDLYECRQSMLTPAELQSPDSRGQQQQLLERLARIDAQATLKLTAQKQA